MSEQDLVVPDLEDVPENDSAEPEDADIEHVMSADELDES